MAAMGTRVVVVPGERASLVRRAAAEVDTFLLPFVPPATATGTDPAAAISTAVGTSPPTVVGDLEVEVDVDEEEEVEVGVGVVWVLLLLS